MPGFAGLRHPKRTHPFANLKLIIVHYHLRPGDIAWAGVGCVHGFRNTSDTDTVRWLETSAPQPPSRYAYRFARDWNYLQEALAAES